MGMNVSVSGVTMLSVLNAARPIFVAPFNNLPTAKKIPSVPSALLGRRATALSLALLPSLFMPTCLPSPSKANADYQYQQDDDEEDRVVRLFQETTRSVVSIKDIEVPNPKTASQSSTSKVAEAIVEGTGSGFVWDKLGHIVTNYHVVAKLASDTTGRQQCEVSLLDTDGNAIVKEGQLLGIDAAHDLAVLKVDVPQNYLRPVMLGSSQSLRVGQSCFAIGNPYGYDHTLTTGETTRSVVSIKDIEVPNPKTASQSSTSKVAEAIVEGTGSGFVWDKLGHIVTNYHVVAKLASDTTGRQQCEVSLLDTDGNAIVKEGQLIGIDAAHDLAVLKVDVPQNYLRPVMLGSSQSLRVGQSCFAIGNPYGYDHTLTTGVVSGLGREIPSPIGKPIQGAIQTDAAINGGNSGGPLIDSFGHVIGVNTATFTRKGSKISSGVNFAIPIDLVQQNVPYLIVYGTVVSNRY